jgi:hypothetical protein
MAGWRDLLKNVTSCCSLSLQQIRNRLVAKVTQRLTIQFRHYVAHLDDDAGLPLTLGSRVQAMETTRQPLPSFEIGWCSSPNAELGWKRTAYSMPAERLSGNVNAGGGGGESSSSSSGVLDSSRRCFFFGATASTTTESKFHHLLLFLMVLLRSDSSVLFKLGWILVLLALADVVLHRSSLILELINGEKSNVDQPVDSSRLQPYQYYTN